MYYYYMNKTLKNQLKSSGVKHCLYFRVPFPMVAHFGTFLHTETKYTSIQ